MNLWTVQLTECQFVDMGTMQTPMWLEVLKEAGPLSGGVLPGGSCLQVGACVAKQLCITQPSTTSENLSYDEIFGGVAGGGS